MLTVVSLGKKVVVPPATYSRTAHEGIPVVNAAYNNATKVREPKYSVEGVKLLGTHVNITMSVQNQCSAAN